MQSLMKSVINELSCCDNCSASGFVLKCWLPIGMPCGRLRSMIGSRRTWYVLVELS